LLKLKKKITNVVQVLSHVKEKLQFTEAEALNLKAELKALDSKVAMQRDYLPGLKNVSFTILFRLEISSDRTTPFCGREMVC
jgi:hypothetical protein